MANKLIKSTKTIFIPGSPGFPADPGQTYIPERVAYEDRQVCGFRAVTTFTGGAARYGWKLVNGQYVQVLVDKNGNVVGGTASTSYTYTCWTEKIRVTYPAQPYRAPTPGVAPVASQTLVDNNLGWNAGARSIHFLVGDGRAKFKLDRALIGAVVGLNDIDVDAAYANIEHGFYASGGVVRIYESGVEKFYAGAYNSGDLFELRREAGVVRYYKNDALIYTSPTPSAGIAFMDTSLYSGGDYIYDPEIADITRLHVTLRPLATSGRGMQIAAVVGDNRGDNLLMPLGSAGGDVAFAQSMAEFAPLTSYGWGSVLAGAYGLASLEPLTSTSRQAARGAAQLPKLVSQGANKVYGSGVVRMRELLSSGQGGMPVPSYALAANMIGPMITGASGLTGEVGGGNTSLALLDALAADHAYGEAMLSLAPMTSSGSAYEGLSNAVIGGVLSFGNAWLVQQALAVVMSEDLQVQGVFAFSIVADAEVPAELQAQTTMSALQSILGAMMNSTLFVGGESRPFDDSAQVWVINTETMANSRYESFNFNSFTKIGAAYFGAKADGVYLLEGDTDDGEPVRGMIDIGLQRFGGSEMKRVAQAYVGYGSTGHLYVKVLVDGQEYVYRARTSSEHLDVHRVEFGRGLRANYYDFELYNEDGADFEIDTIEFDVARLSRRI